MALSLGRFRSGLVTSVSALGLFAACPALAQSNAQPTASGPVLEEIIVTAQRQAESLQDVPIAVSAFSAEALERQQIDNTSDIQLTLPNVTFTKTNFTSSNFAIRGIGEAAVGTSADAGVGIHVNDMPILSPRLFEIEFFDVERIEVLRGPQGTLFGRNATGGVFNVITARPTDEFAGRAEAEYGNFDSIKAQGMINVPLGDMLGFRLAGIYVNRDGYTKNLFDDSRIDGRDQYAFRGTLRFEPTDDTTIDLIGSYFKEDSDRSRIQKQLCHRDPTGVLGCLPDRLAAETVNANATLAATLTSREFLSVAAPPLVPFALGSVAGPDIYSNAVNPTDLRTVNIDYNPIYEADEMILMGRLEHDFGDYNLTVTGGYQETSVLSRTDYNLTAANLVVDNPGARAAQALLPAASRLFQSGNICISDVSRDYVGFIGGRIDRCGPRTMEYDQSNADNSQWSVEAHIDSQFDGPFNFLLGGIYIDGKQSTDYYVAASGLDYAALLLGGGGTSALAAPFYNNEATRYRLKAWAVFGEAYYEFTDELKLTLGARYTTDDKSVRDVFPQPLLGLGTIPYGTASARDRVEFRESSVKFDRLTGRVVLDWKPVTTWSDDTLVYASYSRGYKGGGINPPFDPTLFQAAVTYKPETINAFEIGTKNRFGGGVFQANLTAFYYDYKDYQVSRILARTSVNDNTNARVLGVEGEFLVAPDPAWLFNINASYLDTRIKDLQLVDTRDPSGGRSDVLVIKDLQTAANCVVQSNIAGTTAQQIVLATGQQLIAAAGNPGLPLTPAQRAQIGQAGSAAALAASTAFSIPTLTAPGNFSFCSALQGAATAAASFAGGAAPFTVSDGVAVDLSGNQLQNSPHWKVSVGAQHTWDFDNGMNLVARVDYAFTSESYGRNFNKPVDRIASYDVINAQLTLNGANDAWFVRAFVQNLENDDSVTGMYLTDASSGLFTNVFTLEPRRYGIAAGVRF